MIRRMLAGFICAFLLCSSSPIFAAALVKIGFVDSQEIILKSKRGQAMLEKVNNFREEKQRQIDKMQAEIQKMKDDLIRKSALLTDEAKSAQEDEITKKTVALKRFIEDARQEQRSMEKKLLSDIKSKILEIIRKIGKEQGYTIILGKVESTVLYGNPENDLTDTVLAEFDKAYP